MPGCPVPAMESVQIARLVLFGWVALMVAFPGAAAGQTGAALPGTLPTSPAEALLVDREPAPAATASANVVGPANIVSPAREASVPPGLRDLTLVPLARVRPGKWNFSAGVSGAFTLTDNVNLAPSGQKESDLVLGLSVPMGVRRAGPRVKFLAEYIPTIYLYARNHASDDLQSNLRSFLSWEAVDDFFFIDALANSYPTYISPFQSRPESGASITANRTQQATLGLSPYIKHETSRGWSYLVRSDNFWNLYSQSGLDNSVASRFTAAVDSPPKRVSYGLDYTYLYTNDAGQSTSFYQQVVRLRPALQATRKLNVGARLGYESNNYQVTKYTGAVYGVGVEWTPNPRGRLDGFLEHRFFGPSYGLNVNYRTRRTAWRLSGTRNTYTTIEQPLTLRPATAAEMLNDVFRSRIPDPEKREQEVREFLAGSGLPPTLTQPYTFFTNQVYLSEQWAGSMIVTGRRHTIDLSLFWQENDSVTDSAAVLGTAPFTPFRQQGFTLSVTRRLSGLSSLTFRAGRLYSQTVNSGATAASAEAQSTQDTLSLALTHQLGEKTDGSLALRWVNFDSSGSADLVGLPYQEMAFIAGLAHSF
jgi:uncharacterized protein (PEP-CTERM system associated)